MDKNLKILLGSQNIKPAKNNDVFLNVELKKSFKENPIEDYYNIFDLSIRFKKERNSCRNFFVYGSVESPKIDCDNIYLEVYSSNTLSSSTFIQSVQTTPINSTNWLNRNYLGFKKGKYEFSLINFDNIETIYIYFSGSSDGTVPSQTFSKQIYFTADTINFTGGSDISMVDYGSETVEVLSDGTLKEINNNFPFFYNKHWVKNNLSFTQNPENIRVSFATSFYTVQEGSSIFVDIILNQAPENNQAEINVLFDYTNAPVTHFNTPANSLQHIVFGIGEILKQIQINPKKDLNNNDNGQILKLTLANPIFCNYGDVVETNVTIANFYCTTSNAPWITDSSQLAPLYYKLKGSYGTDIEYAIQYYPDSVVTNFVDVLNFNVNQYMTGTVPAPDELNDTEWNVCLAPNVPLWQIIKFPINQTPFVIIDGNGNRWQWELDETFMNGLSIYNLGQINQFYGMSIGLNTYGISNFSSEEFTAGTNALINTQAIYNRDNHINTGPPNHLSPDLVITNDGYVYQFFEPCPPPPVPGQIPDVFADNNILPPEHSVGFLEIFEFDPNIEMIETTNYQQGSNVVCCTDTSSLSPEEKVKLKNWPYCCSVNLNEKYDFYTLIINGQPVKIYRGFDPYNDLDMNYLNCGLPATSQNVPTGFFTNKLVRTSSYGNGIGDIFYSYEDFWLKGSSAMDYFFNYQYYTPQEIEHQLSILNPSNAFRYIDGIPHFIDDDYYNGTGAFYYAESYRMFPNATSNNSPEVQAFLQSLPTGHEAYFEFYNVDTAENDLWKGVYYTWRRVGADSSNTYNQSGCITGDSYGYIIVNKINVSNYGEWVSAGSVCVL